MLFKYTKRVFSNKFAANSLAVGDFRSDTVTKPCEKMRDAMANAVVGDEIMGDDPTTNKLNKDIAELLGKEAALLTTSGVQANLISMMLLAP